MSNYQGLEASLYDHFWAQEDLDDRQFFTELVAHQGGNCLDLGCGTGRTLVPLAEVGIEVEGVDPAPEMLASGTTSLAGARAIAQRLRRQAPVLSVRDSACSSSRAACSNGSQHWRWLSLMIPVHDQVVHLPGGKMRHTERSCGARQARDEAVAAREGNASRWFEAVHACGRDVHEAVPPAKPSLPMPHVGVEPLRRAHDD